MKVIKYLVYISLQLTWGILQSFIGFVLFMWTIKSAHSFYHGSIRTHWHMNSGISLGLFIFVSTDNAGHVSMEMSQHEYGHTVQSLILGPLYLIIIGLPSIIWYHFFEDIRRRNNISYSAFIIERWADEWGVLATKWIEK